MKRSTLLVPALMFAACGGSGPSRSPDRSESLPTAAWGTDAVGPHTPYGVPALSDASSPWVAPLGQAPPRQGPLANANASSIIEQPAASDLYVVGHGPEAKALIEHYPLENAVAWQFQFIRGVCSGSTHKCLGGANDGQSCVSNAGCASGPLTFTGGETEYFDKDGNSLGIQAFDAAAFDWSTGLRSVGICNGDSTIACASPGGDDADACGSTGDDACNNRPMAGYVPDHANYLLRNPKEDVEHNLVPAESEMRVCFAEFDTMMGCDPLVVRQAVEEYRVPPGPTYIYPLGNPDEAGGVLYANNGHEPEGHHRTVNNQRHAYDIVVHVGSDSGVTTGCDQQNGVCVGGARDGGPCATGDDCVDNANAFIYDQPILAMADGVIVAILHDFPENPNPPDTLPGTNNCDVRACGQPAQCGAGDYPTTGNSVFIQHANGEVSMAAHTIPGTNDALDCGDAVAQGDVIGHAGNSGNSTGPHLHFSTDKLAEFWDSGNYSFPSYYNNVQFAAGPDPTPRRQLDVGMHGAEGDGTHVGQSFTILTPPVPLPENAPVGPGDVAESEPNDTLAGHDALTMPVVVSATLENANVGDLAVRGDGIEDVYRIEESPGPVNDVRIAISWGDGAQNLDVYALTEDLRVLNETGQGTQRSGTEEAVCLALDPGAYYVMVTNVDLTKSANVDYTLDVEEDPETINWETNPTPVQVDINCEGTVEFSGTIHDNCCLDPDNLGLLVQASNPTTNATLGPVAIDPLVVQGPRDILVTGRVQVSDLTSCPAQVVISAQAEDCSGNVVTTAQQGTDAVATVVDLIPPQVTPTGDDLQCLWPPEHEYVCLDLSQFSPTITDNCPGPTTWQFDACTSDQPEDSPQDGPPNGDGHTVDDCTVGPGGGCICARAERAGQDAAGRRYALDAHATDGCENPSAVAMIGNVYVPRDENPLLMCVAAPGP
jgi:peptidase M23-like protein